MANQPVLPSEPESASASAQPESQHWPHFDEWRFRVIAVGFGLLMLLVVSRLLQYQLLADERDLWPDALPNADVPRGVIVDRQGELLAVDRFFVNISATPFELDAADRATVAKVLSSLAGLDAIEVQSTLVAAGDGKYALLAKGLDMEVGQQIIAYQNALDEANEVHPIQSVHVHFVPRRYYPQGALASHVIGLVGVDRLDENARKGYYGAEGYYNSFLWQNGAELPGRRFEPVDELPDHTRRFLPSLAGNDLVLTIDRTIQWIVEDELSKALEAYGAVGGSIIVMEPNTGAILAMANSPSYDPNNYAKTDPLLYSNPAVSAQYEPGSIFKIITMAAALDSGQITPSTIFTDTGSISLGQRLFLNSNRSAVGRVSAADALARSLNVVTVQIAKGLGQEELYAYIRRFGFGAPTEVDLSGEIGGAIKWPYTENWSLSDLGANSFGQGLAVTPLQMTNAAASIANGGKLMRPYVVQARTQGDRMLFTEPTIMHRTLSPQAAADLTAMMVHVVEKGAPAARVEGYSIAGKTGTAQIPTVDGYTDDETIASFVGFAPADDPKFVMLIKLDRPDPEISPWASYTAAPAFAQTAKRLFDHMNIPPDDIRLARTDATTE